eukprot:3940422-Prymnesium_polylepis.1
MRLSRGPDDSTGRYLWPQLYKSVQARLENQPFVGDADVDADADVRVGCGATRVAAWDVRYRFRLVSPSLMR